jgi:intracellular multiplication protein IcmC
MQRWFRYLPIIAILVMFVSNLYAQDGGVVNVNNISLQDFVVNLANQIPQLVKLLTAISYVLGMYFIFIGLFKLKEYGESRTMMSGDRHIKGPIIFLLIGAMLLYFPTSVQIGMSTFWTNPSPYSYLQESTSEWSTLINDIYLIVQLIGGISFIRGLVILSQLSHHGGQPNIFGKGIIHIIAGIFCINIYQFVQTVLNTFFGSAT